MRLSNEQMTENVRRMSDRESRGLDLWTGEPLSEYDNSMAEQDEDIEECES